MEHKTHKIWHKRILSLTPPTSRFGNPRSDCTICRSTIRPRTNLYLVALKILKFVWTSYRRMLSITELRMWWLTFFVSYKKSYVQVRELGIFGCDTAAQPTDLAPNTECSWQPACSVLYEQSRCSGSPPPSNRPIKAGHPQPILAFFTIYGSALPRRGLPPPPPICPSPNVWSVSHHPSWMYLPNWPNRTSPILPMLPFLSPAIRKSSVSTIFNVTRYFYTWK